MKVATATFPLRPASRGQEIAALFSPLAVASQLGLGTEQKTSAMRDFFNEG